MKVFEGVKLLRRRAVRRRLPGFVVLLAALLPATAEAQTMRGTVLDAETGEPAMFARVGLLAEDRTLVAEDLADLEGGFTLEAPSGGSFFLWIERDGYETLLDGVFELGRAGVVEVRVGLTPRPLELDAVTVEAGRNVSRLEASGFYDRVLTAPGHFLTREDIERVPGSGSADLFRGLARVEVDASRPLSGPNVMQYPALIMRGGAAPCSPTLYIDRHVVATGFMGPVRPDDYVSASEIEAIEVYPQAGHAPPEFDPINNCGVVVIWTRIR